MMSAEELESTLTQLQSMGFERDKCMQALRAAFYNADRAVDYLLNGIPAQPTPPVNPNPTAAAGADPGAAAMGGTEGGAGAGDLSFLQNNPMFSAIRERIVREPAFFQTFMNQLAQTQPQIHQAISQNPQAFLSLLLGSGGGAGAAEGAEGMDPPGTIRVTQEEKDAIDRLTSLGFPKHRAIEAYLA
jgi:UV excision repair protein RAD23